ncbi:MAG TPA: hypothetical protein VHR45_06655 [Thermoanaerobaculia bacterium]|nr:hypothetical protein [Thermoanaerobaculia bacterium]
MRTIRFVAAGLLFASAAGAQIISLVKAEPDCIPAEKNGRVVAAATGLSTSQVMRMYFRWSEDGTADKDQKPYYWIDMETDPNGRYWAIPPKPEQRNHVLEYFTAAFVPPDRIASRTPVKFAKVTKNCQPNLDAREAGVSANLTIGETTPDQQKRKVWGFLCDGIATRINAQGIRRADEACRTCVVAWWLNPGIINPILGATVAGGVVGGNIISDTTEPSPSRPPGR